jgi:hypothetical protein
MTRFRPGAPRSRLPRSLGVCGGAILAAGVALGAIIDMTLEDFHLSGTQVFDVPAGAIETSEGCLVCHGPFDPDNDPYSTWRGSLMAMAGRDPLFLAQMTSANQDVGSVGYFCMRCHVPMSFVTGHAYDTDGSTLDDVDRDGVTCHFCHSMVDPDYKPGVSPPDDQAILDSLEAVPSFYGNAMFVLDPQGVRRGPYEDAQTPHAFLHSPFHRTGEFCGTCHDVGNVAVTLQPDGTYRYNEIDQRTPDEDLWAQFPLERTYTEWKLSAFAAGGVDMGGRFGGEGATVVSTCQDCHMPRVAAQGCIFGPQRPDLARHDFAGAAAPVLDLIAELYRGDPAVDQEALAAGRAKSVSMLERAATLELAQSCGSLRVRVFNETGHKLPTGHIEGRRVWVTVRFLDNAGAALAEYGHYDPDEARLDEDTTPVYEMVVGLSEQAAKVTGYPPGPTSHMALADTIVKDTRIPPRGFDNETYAAAGAPAVGACYPDGQHWADSHFTVPPGAAAAEVSVGYQSLTRHYMEVLRDGNVTDDWGQVLYGLWEATGKGAPVEMAASTLGLGPFVEGDVDCDGSVGIRDLLALLREWGRQFSPADLDGSTTVDEADLELLLEHWG